MSSIYSKNDFKRDMQSSTDQKKKKIYGTKMKLFTEEMNIFNAQTF